MPKNIRLPKGTPFKKNEDEKRPPPFYGEEPSRADIQRRLEAQMAAQMYEPRDLEADEDKINSEIDERQLFMQSMMEFLPIFKRFQNLKDPEAIIQLASPLAAKSLVHCMMFGDNKLRESAASKILDRAIGKPVERQVAITADLNQLTDEEVENDISRILHELGPEEVKKLFGSGKHRPDQQTIIVEEAEDERE